MNKSMQRYAPLTKIEDQPDGTIKVWGWCSSEAMDADGDIILASAMAAAMPEFMKFGNIREMHSNIAAGVAFEWETTADGKTWIGTHIVDEGSIKKVKKGVLKGFSIGGNGTECDDNNPKIITALELNEISLVDRPANPDAVINLWKAKKMDTPVAAAPLPSTLAITAETQAAIDGLAEMLNKGEVNPQELLVFAKGKKSKESGSAGAEGNGPTGGASKAGQQGAEENATNKAIDPGVAELPKVAKANGHNDECSCEECMGLNKAAKVTTQATEDQKNADADEHGEMQEKFTKASDKAEPYGDVEYADPGYQEDGKKRYPVDTETHIRAAWSYINKEANAAKYSSAEVSKIKARIVAAWKSKIDPKGPPSAKEKGMETGTLAKASAVNDANGTAEAYPKKDDAVVFKDGEFTHTAKINEVKDGVAHIDGENFEVTVDVAALGKTDAEANEGTVKWVTTMDQAHNWTFKQANKETLESGVSHFSNNGAKTAAAGGGKLLKRYMEKGMYDIVDFAYIMSSLDCLLGYMKFEEVAEGDEASKALQALKAWAEAGKHVMMAIVTEELGELGTAEDLDIVEVLMEKAAGSKLLQKGLGMFLESAGDEAIATMHEFCAVKLTEAAPGNALQKALKSGDQNELVKAVMAQNQTLLDSLEQANARITKLEATPLNGGVLVKGAGLEGQSGKENDVTNPTGGIAPVVTPGTGEVDKAATAFKKSFKSGGSNLFAKVGTQQ